MRHLAWAAALALALLLSVNLMVRSLGGDVHPLAVERVRDRVRALASLGVHALRAPFEAEVDARAALRDAAERHGMSARLVIAVAYVESSLVHTRVSGTGAMGLMQLMPDTARALGVSDPFDPRQNADGGVRYLKQLLATYRGDVRRALAAYNAGPARVIGPAWRRSLPDETREYVTRIFSRL